MEMYVYVILPILSVQIIFTIYIAMLFILVLAFLSLDILHF